MHAKCFPFVGKFVKSLNDMNFQYQFLNRSRQFNAPKAISLKTFRPCRCSADKGDTAASPLPPPPNLKGKAPRKFWNAASLAFLGDSVWEVCFYLVSSHRALF